ncbi:major capsid protein [Thalassovita sp.]|uniref:major capsid protein n=1 Tax=Thalassovita sp. TaxID=1979401 RepID=UPI002AB23FF1|nr:major capsid protein [Thalassovita sp.]
MTHMDIFGNDAFRASELSAAIRLFPNAWGLIGSMGLFKSKGIRGKKFEVELHNGVLQLVQSSERGTALPGLARGKRQLKDFRTERFGASSRITADDIDSIRAFGSETELKQVMVEVAERQRDLRGSLDITKEYLRAGALRGIVRDADGSDIVNLFDEFEVTQKSVDFTLGTGSTDLAEKCREVTRHIKLNLMGDVMTKIVALCHPVFIDRLMGHADFRARYDKFRNDTGKDPLRDDASDGFEFQGIYFKEYLGEASVPQEDGTSITRSFVPSGEAMVFPVGTRQTFHDFDGSADYMGMVNQKGQPFYSAVFPDKQQDRFVDVEAMMQTLPMCLRPGVLVRIHSSN